jgi:pantoate--beta-alanine ligase
MKILHTVEEMRAACRAAVDLGLVPTMGALHEGHLSLVKAARARCKSVAATIFVNPTQFGPNEDFAKYPRNFERDAQLLENRGVDLLFAPATEEMYPAGASTYVTVEGLSERLCGRSRPGHFRGVTTVVSKLFHITEPDVAFFGQKDAAQVAIIRRMVRDLNMAVEIVACPIVREPDGLAMSSRNAYLSPKHRKDAPALYHALQKIDELYKTGEQSVDQLISAGTAALGNDVRMDYLEIVDPESLQPVTQVQGPALVAVAGFLGETRLIDNLVLTAS